MITSERLSRKKGVYEASLLVDSVDGMFDSVSFGMVTRNGEALDLYMTLTPYGLVHTYDRVDKEDVDEVVSLLSEKLAKKVGLTFEESVSADEVGSVEDILGDIVEPQNEEQ